MFIKLLVLSALALPVAVHSAEFSEANSPDSILEEIIVSGYRSISPLGLNASLTLLGQETIQLSTVEHFEELVQMVPNMNLSGEGSRARYFQLRGIGEREQYEGAPNPSVGYIIDDIDLSGIGG
ncbi:MAG: TonB-dependent receptor plug domain-containing protein, partial [Xanthomonadales bacterium]